MCWRAACPRPARSQRVLSSSSSSMPLYLATMASGSDGEGNSASSGQASRPVLGSSSSPGDIKRKAAAGRKPGAHWECFEKIRARGSSCRYDVKCRCCNKEIPNARAEEMTAHIRDCAKVPAAMKQDFEERRIQQGAKRHCSSEHILEIRYVGSRGIAVACRPPARITSHKRLPHPTPTPIGAACTRSRCSSPTCSRSTTPRTRSPTRSAS